jgi:hypothetical protein
MFNHAADPTVVHQPVDLRRTARLAVGNRATAVCTGFAPVPFRTIRDIGADGFSIEGSADVTVGHLSQFEFVAHTGQVLVVSARCIHCRHVSPAIDQSSERYISGWQFELERDRRDEVERFICAVIFGASRLGKLLG